MIFFEPCIKMAKQVFDSLDLVRHIYSYGPEHRDNLAKVHESLKYPTAKDLRLHNILIGYSMPMHNVVQYYRDIRCRCCSRHSHRKSYPMICHQMLCFAPPGNSLSVPEEKNFGDCECHCRHRSRVFIKVILTYGQ